MGFLPSGTTFSSWTAPSPQATVSGFVASTVPGAGHFAFMAQSVWPLASEAGDAAANPEGFDRVAYHATLENEVAEFLDRQLR